jgi:uncharacterized radical SAM protein YgiQ
VQYDIIIIVGEEFFDHPLCGTAILKRLLEKNGYSVGIIEMPQRDEDITRLGKPRLFFGVSSGCIDSMVRNYTPLKRLRELDKHSANVGKVPDRAVTVYSNWIKKHYKDTKIVIGGTEASLRRFVHYDYWDNKLRKPILFDSRADIMAYGNAEKQIVEIAKRIQEGKSLAGIEGTSIISREIPKDFKEMPSFEDVSNSKERFCDMQNMLNNHDNLTQKIDNRYMLQYKSPEYTPEDLDEYYELEFTRQVPKYMRGFEFSVVTHRGCIGKCSFCSLTLLQGDKIISRSEESIMREIKKITKLPHFTGNIDDLGGPTANMYGMDCRKCTGNCIDCKNLDRTNKRLIKLLRNIRQIEGIKNVYIRSGVRYDLATPEYVKEIACHHVYEMLRIAPEHVNPEVLKLMNKDIKGLNEFVTEFNKNAGNKKISFYFMTAHPGSGMKEAKELAESLKKLENAEDVQIFIPTPMTLSTCMYYTGMDPKTKKKIYVPYTYNEKKEQKRLIFRR